jgi:DNA polymerase III subunit gamma/tau
MAHTSLYRTYRPQTFDDVVGQSHITRTLKNAVAEGTVAHAYLFAGPRGTGKTTTARILAKALECEDGPTQDPEGTCEQCIEIAEGRHPDVYELDAASRTGVDNVREEIIGRVSLAPARGRWKVYIIDEVHMLSSAAFNALLKTLEEPPSHVVFVTCTTHPHKVPETIQSRCQRFDFRRISVDDIAERLRYIADAEKIVVPDAALSLMSRHAAGGMRDAITTLEQLAAFGGDTISLEDVEGLLGEVGSDQLFDCADLVLQRNIAGLFRWVAELVESGTDLSEFVRALTAHTRDLYVAASVDEVSRVLDRSESDLPRLEVQAREFGTARLGRMLDLLGELGSEMRWSSDPRLSLEVALTRMARPQGELTLEALDERLAGLEAGGAIASAAAELSSTPAPVAKLPTSSELQATVEPSTAAPAAAAPSAPEADVPDAGPVVVEVSRRPGGPLDRAAARRAWPGVLAEIRKAKPTRAHMFATVDVDVDADGETLVLEFPEGQDFQMELANDDENRAMLRSALAAAMGVAPPFRFQLGRGKVRPVVEAQSAAAPPVHRDPELTAASAPAAASPVTSTAAEPASISHLEVPDDDAPVDDIDRLLAEQFGAKVVAEETRQPDREDES